LVITNMVTAEDRATMNAPARALMEPSLPRVWVAPDPLTTEPRMTNTLHQTAAVRNRIIRVPTAVPNTLDMLLAPSDQPRKRPLEKKMDVMARVPYSERLMT
jgi:hypothetical protein